MKAHQQPVELWKKIADDGVTGEDFNSSIYHVISCQCCFSLECVEILPQLQRAIPIFLEKLPSLYPRRAKKLVVVDEYLKSVGLIHILSLKKDAEKRLIFDALLIVLLSFYPEIYARFGVKQYKTLEEFLQVEDYEDFRRFDEAEQLKLFHFANYLNIACVILPPKSSKTRLMGIIPRITEGKTYSGGGGQSQATVRRVQVYEHECEVTAKKRPWRMPWRYVIDLLTTDQPVNNEDMMREFQMDDDGFSEVDPSTTSLEQTTGNSKACIKLGESDNHNNSNSNSNSSKVLQTHSFSFPHPTEKDLQLDAFEITSNTGDVMIRTISLRRVLHDSNGNYCGSEDFARCFSVAKKDDEDSLDFWNSLDLDFCESELPPNTTISRLVDGDGDGNGDGEHGADSGSGGCVRSIAITRQLSDITIDSNFDSTCLDELLATVGGEGIEEDISFSDWLKGGSLSRQASGMSGLFRSISSMRSSSLLRGVSITPKTQSTQNSSVVNNSSSDSAINNSSESNGIADSRPPKRARN